MTKITLKSFLILAVFSALGIVCEMGTHGVLVLDNQSDYSIEITFYRSNRSGSVRNITDEVNNNYSDTSILIQPNAEWVKSYDKRGGGIDAIGGALRWADSAKIIYGNERIAFSPNPTGRDLIYDASSYIETRTEKGLFRKKVDQTNFRYIFTNADYEAAKPIEE